MKGREFIIAGIILLSFILGIFLYPQMPGMMASHWNVQGQVDSFIPKFWGLFLMPLISVGLILLFTAIPRIDLLKENIEKFREYYDKFVALLMIFLFYIYLLTIFWNIGFKFNMTRYLIPSLGMLIYYVGVLTENAKKNWFVGIRTPWTLSNEAVWNKTNKIGGKMFKISGVMILIGVLFKDYEIYFFLVPVVLTAIYTTIYSYVEYQKLG